MAIVPAIKKRHSIRQYLNKDVPQKLLDEVLKAAMFSPSAKNLRPWEFVVVRDTKQFLGLTPYTRSLETAPVAIVIMADKDKSHHWVEDCSIAAENIMLQATALGLGSCWVNVHGSSTPSVEEKVKKMLSIPNHYGVLCIMALGFPAVKKPVHSDTEFEKQRIHHETF